MKTSPRFLLLLYVLPPCCMLLMLVPPLLLALVPSVSAVEPMPWLCAAFVLSAIACMFALWRLACFTVEQVRIERIRTTRDLEAHESLMLAQLRCELQERDIRIRKLSQQLQSFYGGLQQLLPKVEQLQREQGTMKMETAEQLSLLGDQLQREQGTMKMETAEQLSLLGDQLQREQGTMKMETAEQLSLLGDQLQGFRDRMLQEVRALDAELAKLDAGQEEGTASIGALLDQLEDLKGGVSLDHEKLSNRLVVLQGMVEGISEANLSQLQQLEQSLGALENGRSQLKRRLEARAKALQSRIQDVAEIGLEQSRQLRESLDVQGGRLAKVDQSIQGLRDAMDQEMEVLLARLATVRQELLENTDALSVRQARARNSKLDELSQQLSSRMDAHNEVLVKSNIGNYAHLHTHSRMVSDSDMGQMEQFWLPVLKLDLSRKALGYIAHQICSLEDRCAGRLAASVQDAMLRVLLARSLEGQSLKFLEIGSLYGIALAAVYDNCRGFHSSIELTAVDPFDGFYMTGNDKISGMPVDADLFHHNMQIAAVPQSEYKLVQHLSTDPQAVEQVKDGQFDILIIDGDHSYAGVKFDFETFGRLVCRGGLLLFDDYDQEHWPEVTQFVNEKVKGRRGWKLVGSDWHSIVFRRTGGRSKKKQPS
jgi:hypothetical protein